MLDRGLCKEMFVRIVHRSCQTRRLTELTSSKGEVAIVHHDLAVQGSNATHVPLKKSKKNFEVSIPFSEAFKAKLFCVLQKASEEIEMEQRLRHADLISTASDILSEPNVMRTLNHTSESISEGLNSTKIHLLVKPLLSSPNDIRSNWQLKHRPEDTSSHFRRTNPVEPPCPPLNNLLCSNFAGINALLAPAPLPGTVIFSNTYSVDDPTGRGVVHVLALEEAEKCFPKQSGVHTHQASCRDVLPDVEVYIKVHIMVAVSVPCVVHWGLLCHRNGPLWIRPDSSIWPDGTQSFDLVSVDSPLKTDPRTRMCRLELKIPQKLITDTRNCNPVRLEGTTVNSSKKPQVVGGIGFVLRDVMTDRWIKDTSGQDMYVKIRRERYPDFLARQWRGSHIHLVVQLLQNELHFDPPRPITGTQKYAVLQQLIVEVNNDRMDIDYWAWLFVWWRFAHLRIFDWQLHAHSRPWEAVEIAERTSMSITARWKSSIRNRPIIRLLFGHIMFCPPGEDIRKDLHAILSSWNLLVIPFFEEWYRRFYTHIGVEDFVICRGIIAMFQKMNVSAFWDTLLFYGWSKPDSLIVEAGFSSVPVIPPAFAFLRSHLNHMTNYKEAHPIFSSSFVARHIEQQARKLKVLIDALETLSCKLQALFFGVETEVAYKYISGFKNEPLLDIFSHIRHHRNELRQSYPTLVAETDTKFELSYVNKLVKYADLFDLASRGKKVTSAVIVSCTDITMVRDFWVADVALEHLQQECLAYIYGHTGPALTDQTVIDSYRDQKILCQDCGTSNHVDWTSPFNLLVSPGGYGPQQLCIRHILGTLVRLTDICADLLQGLRFLHPVEEESNSLINDLNAFMTQLYESCSKETIGTASSRSGNQKALLEFLIKNDNAKKEYLHFVSAFKQRVDRCASRIVDLCLVYFSEKVKFLFNCLGDLDLYTPACSGEKMEALAFPPTPPRNLTGQNPLLAFSNESDMDAQASRDHSNELLSGGRAERILRDVHTFVSGVMRSSVLFWMLITLSKMRNALDLITYTPPWRMLSNVNFSTGEILRVEKFADLNVESHHAAATFSRPVILVVEHATGQEKMPFNTRALIMGPTHVSAAQFLGFDQAYFTFAPDLISPLSLEARQMGILCVESLNSGALDALISRYEKNGIHHTNPNVLVYASTNLSEVVIVSTGASNISIKPGSILKKDDMSASSTSSTITDAKVCNDDYENDIALATAFSTIKMTAIDGTLLENTVCPVLPSIDTFCAQPSSSNLITIEDESGQQIAEKWPEDYQGTQSSCHLATLSPNLFDQLYSSRRWFVSPKEFTPLLVGQHGTGFKELRDALMTNDDYKFSACPTLAVPFGSLEMTLRDPENHLLSEQLQILLNDLKRISSSTELKGDRKSLNRDESCYSLGSESIGRAPSTASSVSVSGSEATSFFHDRLEIEAERSTEMRKCERMLRECRSIIRSLRPCHDFLQAMNDLIDKENRNDWDRYMIGRALRTSKEKLWVSIKNVWCSSFTPAIWHAAMTLGIYSDVPRFAVLIQLIEPVAYSFILEACKTPASNSFHPQAKLIDKVVPSASNSSRRTYGELFSGLPLGPGEMFCGGYEIKGEPLAFVSNPRACNIQQKTEILCYSSQAHYLRHKRTTLLLKPDSNVYNIGRFLTSGGLVCTLTDNIYRSVFEYQREPLFSNPPWREKLLSHLVDLHEAIGNRMKGKTFSVKGLVLEESALSAAITNPLSGICFVPPSTQRVAEITGKNSRSNPTRSFFGDHALRGNRILLTDCIIGEQFE